jgi:hypothetical protein
MIMPIVKASTFADFNDVAAYRKAIAEGKSRSEALRLGDDGIGSWGDDTTSEDIPMCALPPEDWETKWGGGENARGKKVRVTYKGKSVTGDLRDTMPHKKNITNGAGIDLNPGFVKSFGLKPGFLLDGFAWEWADS